MDMLMQLLCTAMTVTYASNPYTVLLLPKGDCHMCCPYQRDDVKLYLNIPEDPVERYFDWENGSDWRLLDNNRSIVFYIHGFTEQHTGPASTAIKKAYRERGEDNLVVVDWSILAAAPWYPRAVANTPHTATILAGIIDSLVIRGLSLDRFHVIGFSLGAEIAGLTAKKITVGKFKRVTGLDPALPLYDPVNSRGRLAREDADFVDVIHTDGGIFGFDLPIGHADFFPNGGKPAQPGCRVEILVSTGKINEFVACSHNRAWMFYAESVNDPLAFPAYKCKSFTEFEKGKCKPKGPQAYMGYSADPRLRGKFYLDTKDSKPYGLGFHHDQVSVNYHVSVQQNPPGAVDGGYHVPVEPISHNLVDGDPHQDEQHDSVGPISPSALSPSYHGDTSSYDSSIPTDEGVHIDSNVHSEYESNAPQSLANYGLAPSGVDEASAYSGGQSSISPSYQDASYAQQPGYARNLYYQSGGYQQPQLREGGSPPIGSYRRPMWTRRPFQEYSSTGYSVRRFQDLQYPAYQTRYADYYDSTPYSSQNFQLGYRTGRSSRQLHKEATKMKIRGLRSKGRL